MSASGLYDPEERRATPLAVKLAARIRAEGPITVGAYMAACLADPEHGYYVRQQALGAGGDFVTAPEISQVFGEIIGLWSAVVWQQMGSPQHVDLIEIGPGRGTLMRDALRAARRVPGFLEAVRLGLVEISPVLRRLQQAALAGEAVPIRWHEALPADSESLPAIVIGNEVLDTEPVEQWGVIDGVRCRRLVTLDGGGHLQFGWQGPDGGLVDGEPAAILETRAPSAFLSGLTQRQRCAALLIDYGHRVTGAGDTLQAVRGHRFEHPLASPGQADITAQVDFEAVVRDAGQAGLAVDGPVGQGRFLTALGAVERASRLMGAQPAHALEIEAGVARLLSPTGMGTRFLAIGLRTPELPALPGFDTA